MSFRAWTARTADELGLSGWVRNREDGSVELEAEGPPEVVDRLEQWCHQGSPASRVSAVRRLELSPRGDLGFVVRR